MLSANISTGYDFQWFKDNTAIAGANRNEYIAKENGEYHLEIALQTQRAKSQSVRVTVVFSLPANNFNVVNTAVTCKGAANGSIKITSKAQESFVATVSGGDLTDKQYSFSGTLDLTSLKPGSYSVCLTIAGVPEFRQCFTSVIKTPDDLSVFTALSQGSGNLTLSMQGGMEYHIELNGETLITKNSQVSLALKPGMNTLTVTTDQACQGAIVKSFVVDEVGKPFPNPFVNTVNLDVGQKTLATVNVSVFDVSGKNVFDKKYLYASGIIEVGLSELKTGIYILKMNDGKSVKSYRIIKN